MNEMGLALAEQNNKIIGGIGVSGGSVEQDIHVAEAALRYLPWDLRNS